MCIIRIVIPQMLSSMFSFFRNSYRTYSLRSFLKQRVFFQAFYTERIRNHQCSDFIINDQTEQFCFSLSQIFVSSIFTQTHSCLWPVNRRCHLSWFSFLKPLNNWYISLSNLFRKESRSLSHAKCCVISVCVVS